MPRPAARLRPCVKGKLRSHGQWVLGHIYSDQSPDGQAFRTGDLAKGRTEDAESPDPEE